ncbi:MAG TPA: GntR family transcriptional regulator [Actinomycetota bacterium]|nr:GntR family transcriptional regulator [Actinomycetota bacterium]
MKKRLSFRVRDELAARIASGRIQPGGRLPPEPELAEQLGVSRATLREALRSLEEDGFVTRTRGAGTYATNRPRLRNNLDVNFGVTDAIRAAGREPGTAEVSVSTEAVSEAEAALLDLEPGDPVIVVERVRTADGVRVVVSRDVVSATRLGSAPVVGLGEGSLYELLEREGAVALHHGVVSLEPATADKAMAKRLGVRAGTLLLYLRQVDFDRDGDPVILSHEHHLAEEFEFTVVRRGPGRAEQGRSDT